MMLRSEFGDFEPRSQEEAKKTPSFVLANGQIREIRAIRVPRFCPTTRFA
jgi:hypothetical protein